MEERWDGLYGDGQLEAGSTFGKEGPNKGTLMDSELRLGESEVSTGPALLERRQQSTKEAYDEAQKPERVDPDGRGRWLPGTNSGREELEVLPARVPFAIPSSCWDIWARRMAVFPAESGNNDL